MSVTIESAESKPRCSWSQAPDFHAYHDNEWGFPVRDDFRLFEKLCLESFQSGLSWRLILAKRENFRAAFHHFDFNKIAAFTEEDVNRLLKDEGIVRHRGKIEAVINNAKCAQALVEKEGSLATFIWRFEPAHDQRQKPQTASTSPESVALSKALKKMGWKFVGPTTVFAFMQAMGLINDHAEECAVRAEVERSREAFQRP
ncbi:DNA-3-methyladenine glycosylase I [Hahella sp. KA22]|uniref:DNA-3-methyladenine glycosylase I n=1 Tax=Hahella sp. KA22 TaxID=1628392 RepID=UPI000FDD374B|nr:DNA-3-methyladenine glycosylase I [Hahella sp. KA22]AZZ92625.1 DNA-3-methyladenine glycosylase I [Hahella sp. KA22]QAY55998.1 DNA-3-methyladenine glycosylase I [Hahella sp. KA22]